MVTVTVSDVLDLPGVVTQISPLGNITTTNPTFVWAVEPQTTSYTLVIYGVDAEVIVYMETFLASSICNSTQCSVQPQGVGPSVGDYLWLLRAVNSVGFGSWSVFSP